MNLPDWMVRVTVDFMAEGMFRTDYRTIRNLAQGEGKYDSRNADFCNPQTLNSESGCLLVLVELTLSVRSFVYSLPLFVVCMNRVGRSAIREKHLSHDEGVLDAGPTQTVAQVRTVAAAICIIDFFSSFPLLSSLSSLSLPSPLHFPLPFLTIGYPSCFCSTCFMNFPPNSLYSSI